MSTIQRIQLDRQAHEACALLAQAQYQLLVLRERQLQDADRESALFRDDAMRAEKNAEQLSDAIEAVCLTNHLDIHGSPPEQLVRIAGLLDAYAKAHDESQQEIARLRAELAEAARIPPQGEATEAPDHGVVT